MKPIKTGSAAADPMTRFYCSCDAGASRHAHGHRLPFGGCCCPGAQQGEPFLLICCCFSTLQLPPLLLLLLVWPVLQWSGRAPPGPALH
jgi:hypothetical protein